MSRRPNPHPHPHPHPDPNPTPTPHPHQAETGLDNSTLILPDEDSRAGSGAHANSSMATQHSVINHCRWDRLSSVLPAPIFKVTLTLQTLTLTLTLALTRSCCARACTTCRRSPTCSPTRA